MKHILKPIAICITSAFIFSCSASRNSASVSGVSPELPDARTIPSVKSLKVQAGHIMCGSNFSSELSENQMLVKTSFNDDKTFKFAFTFFDSLCSVSGTTGNKIASYDFSGSYSVTNQAGQVIMTVTNSTMTILAGDYPVATKKFVDWMNSCSDLEGHFSQSENTTLMLPLGPKCNANVTRAFNFVPHGSSQESSEEELARLVITNPN